MNRIVFLITIKLLLASICWSQQSVLKEEQLKRAVKNAKQGKAKVQALINLGDYYENVDATSFDSVAKIVSSNLKKLQGNELFEGMVFVAKAYEKSGNDRAYNRWVISFNYFNDNTLSTKLIFEKHIHLSFYYANILEKEKAQKSLKIALSCAQKLRNFTLLSKAHVYIAYNFMLSNKKQASINATEEAILFARRSGYKKDLSEAFYMQAKVYNYFGQVEQAVAKNLVALQLASVVTDTRLMIELARELGQKQLFINNLKDAEYFLSKSLEYAKQLRDNRQIGLVLTSKASIFCKTQTYDEAIKMNEKAIRLLEGTDDINGLGEACMNLGLVYKDLNAHPLAVKHFDRAIKNYELGLNREKIAEVYYLIATIFRKQKRLDQALVYLKKSLILQEQLGNPSKVIITYRELSEIFKLLGKTEKALAYLEQYVTYSDVNSSIQASRKIAELSESYRSEQRDRLIAMQADSLEKQNQEKDIAKTKLENISLRNKFQTYLIIGILILIFLSVMIVVARFNSVVSKQKQKDAEMAQTLLRTQMNPHFIFNAMSVIQSYILANDTVNSSRFLVEFSKLMRLILENSPKEFIPVETEMDILTKYLETQKLRFEQRFDFTISCPMHLINDMALIPPMITQPFVENAIEHGRLDWVENGTITIRFSKVNAMLLIEIEDNGVGRTSAEMNKKSKSHNSLALKITRERIENINFKYKAEGMLIIEDLDKIAKTGTKVVISLPYRMGTT